jgi:hypothetical protein
VRLRLFLILAAAPLAGCVNTDTAVFVDPTIDTPAATITSNALGTYITGGSFHLKLHLGARASGPSTVKLGEFSILDAQKKGDIVSPLDVTSTTQFPVTVQPDTDVDADFTLVMSTKSIGDVGTQLCDPAGVVIGGTIQDSLVEGTSTPVSSAVFKPACM